MTAQMDKPVFAAPAFSETSEEKARRLLRSASKAVDQLEADVSALVAMRAWTVLGYVDFSEMWKLENGFPAPPLVKVMAVDAMMAEGMNTARGPGSGTHRKTGHTIPDVARAIGYDVQANSNGRGDIASAVTALKSQREHGVPVEHRVARSSLTGAVVAQYGRLYYGRKRPQPRRMGKAPDELVDAGFMLSRRDADAISDIARKADVPKAEIYRQAVAEYLARYRESRPTTVKR